MVDNKKVLALIPARGGSKGIKDKNIIDVEGKPLIAYTIEAATTCKYIDKVVVTTDSERIKNVSEKYGADVPFFRPKEYATDKATTLSAVIHAISKLEEERDFFDILVLLQPTSPLRTKEDIEGAIEKFIKNGCQSLVAISLVTDPPVLMRQLIDDNHMKKILSTDSSVRRQDMPDYYRVNGSIYINSIKDITECTSFNDNVIPYIIDIEHAVDIDDYKDLELVKYYIKKNHYNSTMN